MNIAEKRCIFCGSYPRNKTDEHIIPKWLIKLTGNPKRPFYLGPNYGDPNHPLRVFPAKEFHFPACNECNSEKGKLEEACKPVIIKMLSNTALNSREVAIFLDWLDKIRIGLWLGFRYLEKNFFGIKPNFHINERIACSDRMVAVYSCGDAQKSINFPCTNCPVFMCMPSCFTLSINNLFFFNMSTDFLISRRIGLPFPHSQDFIEDSGQSSFDIQRARKRIMRPIIKAKMHKAATIFYQPIAKKFLRLVPKLYNNEYVKDIIRPGNSGKGVILIEQDNKLFWLDDATTIKPILPSYQKEDRRTLYLKIAEQTLRFQTMLYKPILESLKGERKKSVKLILATQESIRESVNEQIG